MSEIDDRRQQALAAAYDIDDESVWGGYPHASLTTAIEVATQVKITDDIVKEFNRAWTFAHLGDMLDRRRAGIKAAFRAAGFEVVE